MCRIFIDRTYEKQKKEGCESLVVIEFCCLECRSISFVTSFLCLYSITLEKKSRLNIGRAEQYPKILEMVTVEKIIDPTISEYISSPTSI